MNKTTDWNYITNIYFQCDLAESCSENVDLVDLIFQAVNNWFPLNMPIELNVWHWSYIYVSYKRAADMILLTASKSR